MDKNVSFMIFEVLYWLGVRNGEALALTSADFDLKRGRVSITKTYHRIDGEDVTTPPNPASSPWLSDISSAIYLLFAGGHHPQEFESSK